MPSEQNRSDQEAGACFPQKRNNRPCGTEAVREIWRLSGCCIGVISDLCMNWLRGLTTNDSCDWSSGTFRKSRRNIIGRLDGDQYKVIFTYLTSIACGFVRQIFDYGAYIWDLNDFQSSQPRWSRYPCGIRPF